jgi:hypothetical protein
VKRILAWMLRNSPYQIVVEVMRALSDDKSSLKAVAKA